MICITLNSSSLILAELGYEFHIQLGLNEKEREIKRNLKHKILLFILSAKKNNKYSLS